jgi:ATP-dependent helicase/nuclease subunit B
VSPVRPRVFTIPPHRAFADALAAGLIARFGGGDLGLAQGIVLVPNNRAAWAIADAFVRRSGGGLLLPRLVPVGDPELDERIGGALEPLGEGEELPPAIEPLERLFLLAALVQQHVAEVDAAEALRLAEDLARTLDQLLVEGVEPSRLRAFASEPPDLSNHWQASLERLTVILDQWPKLLAARDRIDLADRRNRLLAAVAGPLAGEPARRLRRRRRHHQLRAGDRRPASTVSRLADGMVVFPGLDLGMAEDEWDSLGPHEPDEATGPSPAPFDRDPPAVPPQAAARPHGDRPRRGGALALGRRRPRRSGRAQPRHRQRHEARHLHRPLAGSSPGRSAPHRSPRPGAGRPGRGSAGDRHRPSRGA